MTPVETAAVPPGATAVVLAKDQPEYAELPAVVYEDGLVMTEWILTATELHRMLCGGRIRIWLHTFQQPVQPLSVEVIEPDCGIRES